MTIRKWITNGGLGGSTIKKLKDRGDKRVLFTGPPKANEKFTTQQLENMGLFGIYCFEEDLPLTQERFNEIRDVLSSYDIIDPKAWVISQYRGACLDLWHEVERLWKENPPTK